MGKFSRGHPLEDTQFSAQFSNSIQQDLFVICSVSLAVPIGLNQENMVPAFMGFTVQLRVRVSSHLSAKFYCPLGVLE